MIAKHSHEQSGNGEGVAVIKNEPCDHPEHGKGQFTEKHIYLSRFPIKLWNICVTFNLKLAVLCLSSFSLVYCG
jgi:Phosphatidylinositol transfer protein